MKSLLLRLWREEDGRDVVRMLISLIAVASITTAGQAVSNAYSNPAVVTTTSGT